MCVMPSKNKRKPQPEKCNLFSAVRRAQCVEIQAGRHRRHPVSVLQVARDNEDTGQQVWLVSLLHRRETRQPKIFQFAQHSTRLRSLEKIHGVIVWDCHGLAGYREQNAADPMSP